jgi:membrane protein insertase Oxa1/YidC/SpoIIIJ
VIASSYPLLDIFWTMLWFFLFFIWIWLVITVFVDLFRSHDLSGWAKAGWAIFLIVLPLLGVLFYLIFRGGSMQQRQMQDAAQQEQAFRNYVQQATATSSSTADELAKLAELRDRGVITPEEFERQKATMLGTSPAPPASPAAEQTQTTPAPPAPPAPA